MKYIIIIPLISLFVLSCSNEQVINPKQNKNTIFKPGNYFSIYGFKGKKSFKILNVENYPFLKMQPVNKNDTVYINVNAFNQFFKLSNSI